MNIRRKKVEEVFPLKNPLDKPHECAFMSGYPHRSWGTKHAKSSG